MTWEIRQGNALERLREMPDGIVQTCVTSPPYWGLRDYGTAEWEGGDAGCDHRLGNLVSPKSGLRNDGREHIGPYEGEKNVTNGMPYRTICGKCGAHRIDSQLGLEPTPDCGQRGYFRLRADLTEAQREFVARRLAGVESSDA